MAANSSTFSSKVGQATWAQGEKARFALKLLALLLAVWAVDYAVGSLLKRLSQNTRNGELTGKINLALEQPSEILVFGDSRASLHYIPEILAEATGMSAFNLGLQGQLLLSQFGVEQLILDRYTPKLMILDLSYYAILADQGQAYDRLSLLLPFHHQNAAVTELLMKRSPYESWKLWSKIYPYNSQLISIAKYTLFPQAEEAAGRRGYFPTYGSRMGQIIQASQAEEQTDQAEPGADHQMKKIDPDYRQTLVRFLQSALEKNVKVVVCQSPRWPLKASEAATAAAVEAEYARICAGLRVPVIKITRDTDAAFANPELYFDPVHLNHQGAGVFSKLLGAKLKALLDQHDDAE